MKQFDIKITAIINLIPTFTYKKKSGEILFRFLCFDIHIKYK